MPGSLLGIGDQRVFDRDLDIRHPRADPGGEQLSRQVVTGADVRREDQDPHRAALLQGGPTMGAAGFEPATSRV